MLAIVVTLTCHPGREADMIAALEGNAAGSRQEPTCLKWEWSQQKDDPTAFAIYELYPDQAAIDAHKASEHFSHWLEAIEGVMATKTAGIYEVNGVDSRPV